MRCGQIAVFEQKTKNEIFWEHLIFTTYGQNWSDKTFKKSGEV
jgi:hypothetical protein